MKLLNWKSVFGEGILWNLLLGRISDFETYFYRGYFQIWNNSNFFRDISLKPTFRGHFRFKKSSDSENYFGGISYS